MVLVDFFVSVALQSLVVNVLSEEAVVYLLVSSGDR